MKTKAQKALAGRAGSEMPVVTISPMCSECRAPYVLRRCFVVAVAAGQESGVRWLWQRDCKHKNAKAVVSEPGEASAASAPVSRPSRRGGTK